MVILLHYGLIQITIKYMCYIFIGEHIACIYALYNYVYIIHIHILFYIFQVKVNLPIKFQNAILHNIFLL